MKQLLFILVAAACLSAQGLDPSVFLKPPNDAWLTYYGDYSGQRYSRLSQINRTNVKSLTLAWTFKTNAVALSTGDAALDRSAVTLTSVPLEVNGVLYFTLPDHVWAVEGRTGRLVWHFYRPAPGSHVMNRGVAMYKNQIYFGTSDAHVISLDARNGKKLWDVAVGDVTFGQAIIAAPIVVRNHVIIGSSGDGANLPGFAMALDPENGSVQWKWEAVPRPGQPRSETWPDGKPGEDIMAHGGGNPAMTPTYDPGLNLLYFGTGAPRPVMAGVSRPGSNLYTCSIVALDVDTGQMTWYFQASPHDTHGWDATQPVVLFDAQFNGEPRKLLAQANRNGYFFLLDRATGENLLSSPFVPMNWSAGVDKRGRPTPKPEKEPKQDGVLVLPDEYGATNWTPPSYSSDTKLFYVTVHGGRYAIFYLALTDDNAKRRGGVATSVGKGVGSLAAIDYKTGQVRWSSAAGGAGGVLSTSGGLLFTSGTVNSVVALDAASGNILWHSSVGTMSNSAITYEIDDRQYIVTPVEDTLYAWSLPHP